MQREGNTRVIWWHPGCEFTLGGCIATIGVFDGIHLGHQQLIKRVVGYSEGGRGGYPPQPHNHIPYPSVVITFDKLPERVLFPGGETPSLYPLTEKIKLISMLGAHYIIIIPFDEEFARIEPEDFVREFLVGRLGVRGIVVGASFRFGRNRRGDITLLKEMGEQYGLFVEGMEPVLVSGNIVSATLIRSLIKEGRVSDAEKMLGRKYQIRGQIVRGEHLGTQLGFPTANVHPHDGYLIPGNGIYAGVCTLPDGESKPATIYIGTSPTLIGRNNPVVEVFIHDFTGILYNQQITITFYEKLRDEVRFNDIHELKKSIQNDIDETRRKLGTSYTA